MYFLLAFCLPATYDNLRSRAFYPLGNVLLLSALKSVNICNYLSIPQVTAGLLEKKKKEDGSTVSDKMWRIKMTKSRLVGLNLLHWSKRLSCFIHLSGSLYFNVMLTTQNPCRCKCMSFCVYALACDYICLFACVWIHAARVGGEKLKEHFQGWQDQNLILLQPAGFF